MRAGVLVSIVVAALAVRVSGAQSAILVGTVARDSAGHMLGGAEVRLPALGRATTTNFMGQFRFTGLTPGRYAINVRSVGFQPYADSVDVALAGTNDQDLVLRPSAITLDTVTTRAAQARKYISPGLRGFEERRLSGQGGYFISDSLFRANEAMKMPDVLGRIPSMLKVPVGANTYLASGRSIGTDGGPAFQSKKGANVWCFLTVYVDGVRIFQAPATGGSPPPDFNRMSISDYAGAEYYPGGASVPAEYNATGSSCGVLLLWTRER